LARSSDQGARPFADTMAMTTAEQLKRKLRNFPVVALQPRLAA
jgi:hypothetical protein